MGQWGCPRVHGKWALALARLLIGSLPAATGAGRLLEWPKAVTLMMGIGIAIGWGVRRGVGRRCDGLR